MALSKDEKKVYQQIKKLVQSEILRILKKAYSLLKNLQTEMFLMNC